MSKPLSIVACGLLCLWARPGVAQSAPDSDVTISTDRPSVANSSAVVPKGALQFENGLLVTATQGQEVVDLPETSIRYGLLSKTELRLAVPDFFCNLPSGTTTIPGFGDLALGVKQQLGPLPGKIDLSVIVFVSFPTGAHSVSSHGYDPGLQFPWSRALSKNWTVAGQMAFYWPTVNGSHLFTGESTVYFDRQLTKPWDAFVEYSGDFPHQGGPRHQLHLGTSYKLAAHHQIDIHGAVGLSAAAPDHYVGVGYSFLILTKK